MINIVSKFLPVTLLLAITVACVPLEVQAGANYAVSIKTSDRSGAGTDSNIFLTLYGTKGNSDKIRVNPLLDGDAFESGDSDTFTPNIDKDLGVIIRVNVESAGDYAGSDWHLKEVSVTYYTPGAFQAFQSSLSNPVAGLQKLNELKSAGKIVDSTFPYNNWINGGEKVDGTRPGVDILRSEKTVEPVGRPGTSPARIYLVFNADALDSGNPVSREWTSEITKSESLVLEDSTSNRTQIGATAEYGYSPADSTGGSSVKLGLSAEYEHIKANLKTTSNGTSSTVTTSQTFNATPGTMEFRVVVGSGTVMTQGYRSSLSGKTFTATYASADADLNPRQVTFVKNSPDDAKWNRSLAHAFRVSHGEANYNSMVRRLKSLGCLNNPLTAAQALAQKE